MGKPRSSSPESSPVGELLVQRCGFDVTKPEDAIRALVSSLVATEGNHRDAQCYFSARRIDPKVAIVDGLPCDGIIEPKGDTFTDGFMMRLRSRQSAGRLRFTTAHELCHTFFYELIPELKFRLHTTDPVEERLCNIGAEEMLMPLAMVETEAHDMPVSLDSLEQLADRFAVSPSAMLVRLRQAQLWRYELAYWHRMMDGSFVLDRKMGGMKADWKMDWSILQRAWESGRESVFGFTSVYFERADLSAADHVYYEARRQGASVVTLWGRRKFGKRNKALPLFWKPNRRKE